MSKQSQPKSQAKPAEKPPVKTAWGKGSYASTAASSQVPTPTTIAPAVEAAVGGIVTHCLARLIVKTANSREKLSESVYAMDQRLLESVTRPSLEDWVSC